MQGDILITVSDDTKEKFAEKCKQTAWSVEEALFIFMDRVNMGALNLHDIICDVGGAVEYKISHTKKMEQ